MKADLYIKNAGQLVTSRGASAKPKTGAALGEIDVIPDGAVAAAGSTLIFVGTTAAAEQQVEVGEDTLVMDGRNQVVLPGLVDAHTHLVFGGSREHELDLKLQGVPYLDILAQGGGILSTVRATRAASLEELVEIGKKYGDQMLSQGTTTIEAKSGYGLCTADEIKQLRAIREINRHHPLDIVPTFLGAHAVPPEYKEDPDQFVELVINEMLPQVAREELAEFCDIFCEKGVFSADQSRRILRAAQDLGLKIKIHADEIAAIGGSQLAAELGAVSADHLLVTPEESIEKMAAAGVMACLLPATTFYLREDHFAPARKMIAGGVPVALASDFNPGSCPCHDLHLVMTIACLYLKMTPAEVINAVTINAAHAIGRAATVGSLEVGKKADIVLFDAPNYQYLPYRLGSNLVRTVIKNGKLVRGGSEHGATGRMCS
ncbi:imidazolonepropionase [Candidatus Formimonas warabiya]|uniref:Imidazolonepropionase n=1 Tax=Formimonas warabiya TaxID=1761012 RepID=A0A3G1KRQ9_FORW1|nr:imidazolonepropionase [Candidatus Formimonas warabiya]ATW25172.1 imidazolonepropionase [Candidatus Formimonas warabiya]